MLDKKFARHFASEWLAAWNSHDLARILSHYAEDFEMSSPVILQLTGEPTGKLKGKAEVGAYWEKALKQTPDLMFTPISTFVGANSLTILYRGHRGEVLEVFLFGADGLVSEAFSHHKDTIDQ